MDTYEMLRQIIDAHPSRAPKSKAMDKILHILFTPDEAELAVQMSFKPKKADEIAQSAGVPEKRAVELLDAMSAKTVIFYKEKDGVRRYGLLPTIPGLFEFPFMKGKLTPEHETLAKLWEEYHHEALGSAFAGNPTPAMRIVPVGETLPVRDTVVPYQAVSAIIENAETIGLTSCACRVSVGKCDKPLDVCMLFGPIVDFLEAQGSARRIDKDEALRVLNYAEDAGLVHTTENHQGNPSVICNCCSCCCTLLRGITELHHPHAIALSPYLAEVNAAGCTGCSICADERCPMGAIEMKDDVARVKEEDCIGCGLCASGCPEKAIEMVARQGAEAPPKNVQEMGVKIMQEKGTLEQFMKVMQK